MDSSETILWVEVEGYPDYMISTEGEIKRIRHTLTRKSSDADRHKMMTRFVRNKSQEPFVSLCLGGAKSYWHKVSWLVWKSFEGPIPRGKTVAYIDGDVHNCNINNLHLVDSIPETSTKSRAWEKFWNRGAVWRNWDQRDPEKVANYEGEET